MKSTAILLGATGLIGGHILDDLKSDPSFDVIKILVRRPFEDSHPKAKVEVIDFDDKNQFESAMQDGDFVFSAIGTTQKKVKGNKEKYRKIDFDITVNAAKYASSSGAKHFLVVSSVGSDSKKSGFYLKLKGEVEDALIDLSKKEGRLQSLSIFRPSLLLGERSERRIAEGIGQFFSKALSFLFPKNMKPIKAKTVAKSMVEAAKLNKKGVQVYYYQEMKDLCL